MKSKEDSNIVYLNKTRKMNKSKIAGLVIIAILILIVAITYILYATNEEIRYYFDENILSKNIEENNLNKILLEDYDKSTIFAYQDKIMILKANVLEQYNTSAKKDLELNVEISTPISSINGKYFMIAEKDSSKLYMIEDSQIKWEKTLEGNISKIYVNRSGISSVILSGTAYKSVIVLFDEYGNEIFKTYLSSTIAIDTAISEDGKYLGFAEVNTNGTVVNSNIKIISIDKAKANEEDSIIYTYNAEQDKLILNIEYQKNGLVCIYDDSVHIIKDNQDTEITTLQSDTEKITYASIELDEYLVKTIEEKSSLLDTQTTVKLMNTKTLKENSYKFEGVTKKLYTCKNRIALNLGSEIHFIDCNGWLIKKYTATQEIRNVVISEKVAGVVYRNKIEIVKL